MPETVALMRRSNEKIITQLLSRHAHVAALPPLATLSFAVIIRISGRSGNLLGPAAPWGPSAILGLPPLTRYSPRPTIPDAPLSRSVPDDVYHAAARTLSGIASGLLALLRNSMVMKTISLSPRFSRSWTLNSRGP